ncbi:MAG TPA: hypothetical protein VEU51_08000 [Candidatus Acidoferrales bacterium]|nr:hypothetical protein [Candidatus Acidoferrales bacterium]
MTTRLIGLAIVLLLAVAAIPTFSACDPCASCGGHHNPPPPPPPGACAGQGLIGLDPVNNVGYVPLNTTDMSGNAQVAVVNLAVGAPNPVIKTLALNVGGSQGNFPEALAYNPANKTILAESVLTAGGVGIFEIDTNTQTVLHEVDATGLDEFRGGVLQDFKNNRAFVAGLSTIGILDTSTSPPVWNAASVVSTVCTDSLALNVTTGLIFITCDGNNQIIDSTVLPLVPKAFQGGFGTSDGNAFDPSTNIMILGQEFVDANTVFNMATLNTGVNPATADNVTVPGLGAGGIQGEGQGMAAINCATHQGVLADEGGQNVRLIQLPTSPVAGALDNNGQPGTNTTADASSAFTIATALLPPGPNNVSITMQGDPNSASVDPAFNFYYAIGNGNEMQFLIRLDLSKPVLGGSPTGGPSMNTFWTPTVDYIQLP